MPANQRRHKIIEMLTEDGVAKVTQLSKIFKVSEVTIRRDLDKLERGVIAREHGGAYLQSLSSQVQSLTFQRSENMDRKTSIGIKAAGFIQDGDTIILDSGSTVTEICKHIGERASSPRLAGSFLINSSKSAFRAEPRRHGGGTGLVRQ